MQLRIHSLRFTWTATALAAFALFASGRLAVAQVTFTDSFTGPVNFLTNGVAGTIWDGLYLGAGEISNPTGVGSAAGSVSVADAGISGINTLTFASLQTDWENAADDGVFLFKVITGDFDMSVQVVAPADTGSYNLPGLMVRAFGLGGSPAPNSSENSFLWARFDYLNYVNMLKNNVNGAKTDTVLGAAAPNTNYWLRITRSGNVFTLFEKATQAAAWNSVGTVTRTDFSGVSLQVGIEHSDYAGGATRTARYANFSLIVSNLLAGSVPGSPSGLVVSNSAFGVDVSWVPGSGSAGTIIVASVGTNNIRKQAPANGITYTANAGYGLGDTLPAANYRVVYSGSGTSVTVSNLPGLMNCNIAAYSYSGSGASRVYSHQPATASIVTQPVATPLFAAWAAIQNADVSVSFNSVPGKWYRLEGSDSLNPPAWEAIGASPALAAASIMTSVHSNGALLPEHYYRVQQLDSPPVGRNIAVAGAPLTSYVSGWETLSAINDGYTPANSADHTHGAYGNWPQTGTQWVEYDWPVPINTGMIDVYWWADGGGIAAPAACRAKYWDGANFVLVDNVVGLGVALNQFNTTTFTAVTTTRLRLEFDSGSASTGIIEWRVYDAGGSPTNFPPSVFAGIDRDVVVGGNTYLDGTVLDDGAVFATPTVTWSQLSGPGSVTFGDAHSLTNTAVFSVPGAAVLQLSAFDGQYSNTSTLNVTVAPAPPATHALPVYVAPYTISSRLWRYRLNRTLTNWIPHLYAQLNNTSLAEGNINSFMQASNRLAGKSYSVPNADPWADAYTLNTVEAMCYALMYDPQGDPAVLAAQAAFRTNLNYWIPIILGAQESDGYLHTYTTLRSLSRWSNNSLHEGYVGGYFIEAGLAHYLANNRTNAVLYDAAKKLADCWCNNIGPGKKTWFDGHENIEQALVHLGRFMNEFEGPTNGQKYINLAKYLMDVRGTPAANAALGDGSTYDQSHVPSIQQYEAVGHAVRAVYLYSGIEDVAMETGSLDYHSAALSLCDNLVNRKYYVTGGVGSGESSEGFGANYSLPNSSYCETCAGCGTLFFFHKLNLMYEDAKYADLMENVLYNEVLGSLDDPANKIFYPNPLNSSAARLAWTGVPCCYGNAARTLFEMPTWIYARTADSIFVNLFVGSSVTVSNISGTTVQLVQNTDYPWTNRISIVVNPAAPAAFTVQVRIPNRTMSALYTPTPAVSGFTSMALNDAPITPGVTNGYVVLTRTWTAGDHIDLVLPMTVQRIKASNSVAADLGRVALQYGPLIYNIESVDQSTSLVLNPASPLTTSWNGSLLGGMTVINGTWTNGAALMAIPNYSRLNRGGSTAVWFRDQ